jgi:hypothetical protein
VACTQNGRAFDIYKVSLRFPLSFPNRKVSGWHRTDRPPPPPRSKDGSSRDLIRRVRRVSVRPNMSLTDTFFKTATPARAETLE